MYTFISMNNLFINLVIVAATASVCCATVPPVKQCQNKNFEDLENRIEIIPCSPNKCKLPQDMNVTVAFRFKPKLKVEKLTNDVYADFGGGLIVPFIGTSGTSACSDVRFADTDKQAVCPLEPGVEYIYKNNFYIYPIYPTIDSFIVHWSLDDGKRKVICFEVPAAIVKAKKKSN